MRRRVIVLGAGMVGVCCALALRRHGFEVELIDLDSSGTKGRTLKGRFLGPPGPVPAP